MSDRIPDGLLDDRLEFHLALEAARAECDPCQDWNGFREALWAHLAPTFGFEVGGWPDALPHPARAPAGADASEVAAWMRTEGEHRHTNA